MVKKPNLKFSKVRLTIDKRFSKKPNLKFFKVKEERIYNDIP